MKETLKSSEELIDQLDTVRKSPNDRGTVDMIVARPAKGQREVLVEAELHDDLGLVGDSWSTRLAHPESTRMLTLMNSRAIGLIAPDRSQWPLAGDQLFVDLNLSYSNIPPGSQLRVGETIIEVTEAPHLGCKKFMDRFGREATLLVNSDAGRALNLRGINAKVVASGRVTLGDTLSKI